MRKEFQKLHDVNGRIAVSSKLKNNQIKLDFTRDAKPKQKVTPVFYSSISSISVNSNRVRRNPIVERIERSHKQQDVDEYFDAVKYPDYSPSTVLPPEINNESEYYVKTRIFFNNLRHQSRVILRAIPTRINLKSIIIVLHYVFILSLSYLLWGVINELNELKVFLGL